MKNRLWTVMLPVSLTIFPGTPLPLEEIFGTSHRRFSASGESGFHPGYGQLAPDAEGQLAAIPHGNLLPTYEMFPADNSEITSQHSSEMYQPVNSYAPNQARHGVGDTENGPLIAPQGGTYGQHFESYDFSMEHGHHFDPYALPTEHHTSHEFATNLPRHDNPPLSHEENPNADNFLYDHLHDRIHGSFSNLIAFSPELDSNQARLISSGKNKAPAAHFQRSAYPTLDDYQKVVNFFDIDHSGTSNKPASNPIQANSKDYENSNFSKEMKKKQKLSPEHSAISPESMPPSEIFSFLQLVKFKPSSIDGQVMMEAINGIKLPDGRKFMKIFFNNIDPEKHLTIVENPSRGKAHELSSKYQELSRSVQVHIPRVGPYGSTRSAKNKRKITIVRSQKVKQTSRDWKNFLNAELRFERPSKILRYKEFVMEDIERRQEFPKLESKIQHAFAKNLLELRARIDYLTRIERILPAFFFYVDLMTTLFPTEDLKNGKLLRTTRENAGQIMLELIEKKLLQPDISKNDSELADYVSEDIAVRKVFEQIGNTLHNDIARETSFNWKLLYYWMLKSRKELLDEGPPSTEFKGFLNECFTTWVEHQMSID